MDILNMPTATHHSVTSCEHSLEYNARRSKRRHHSIYYNTERENNVSHQSVDCPKRTTQGNITQKGYYETRIKSNIHPRTVCYSIP